MFIKPISTLISSTMKGPIAIIGAGPCGLSLARLLFRKNINFVVYEREASASALTASGSLDIRKDSGQRVLREAGLYDAFARQARWEDDRVTFFDKSGTALHTTGEGEREVGEDGSMTGGQPEIDRKELQNILLASIPEDKIIWGHRLRSLTFRGEKRSPILDFGNGQTAGNFPLIVGTDGAWSKVRAAVYFELLTLC